MCPFGSLLKLLLLCQSAGCSHLHQKPTECFDLLEECLWGAGRSLLALRGSEECVQLHVCDCVLVYNIYIYIYISVYAYV